MSSIVVTFQWGGSLTTGNSICSLKGIFYAVFVTMTHFFTLSLKFIKCIIGMFTYLFHSVISLFGGGAGCLSLLSAVFLARSFRHLLI